MKVAWASNQAEAEMIEGILNAEGIPCMIQRQRGFDVADFLAAGPRNILVPALAEERAREILADLEATDPESLVPGSETAPQEEHDQRFDAPDFPS